MKKTKNKEIEERRTERQREIEKKKERTKSIRFNKRIPLIKDLRFTTKFSHTLKKNRT